MSPHPDEQRRLSGLTRIALGWAAFGLIALWFVAYFVEPDPRGFGTHERLGLAPCAFFGLTGRRCPSCGMTTAFAWWARGQVRHAMTANVAGALLAPATVVLILWFLGSAFRGRPWGTRTVAEPLIRLVVATAAISLLAWTARILMTL